MNLLQPVPTALFWLSTVLAAFFFFWAVATASWRKLLSVNIRQHLWYGAIASLGVGWAVVGVTVHDTMRLHPMLVTSITLVFGFRLAVISSALALAITALLNQLLWQALPYVWLVSVVAPALITYLLLRLVSMTRVQNLFLYTLGVGFFGGVLTPTMITIATGISLWLFEANVFKVFWGNAYLLMLFTFPEGFLNGMIVSALAIMAPSLVKTYDDDFYLR